MKTYKVYSVKNAVRNFLASFDNKLEAMRYAIDKSNESDCPSLVYGRSTSRALYFTHRTNNGTYTICK